MTSSVGREKIEAAIVSDLRRATGRFPNNSRLTDLIQALTVGNQRFAELWAAGAVGAHREAHKTIEHPRVGPIMVDCDVMTDGDAELKIVILTAAAGTEDETKLRLACLGSPIPLLAGANGSAVARDLEADTPERASASAVRDASRNAP